MNKYAERGSVSKANSELNRISPQAGSANASIELADNRPTPITQRKFNTLTDNRPGVQQLKSSAFLPDNRSPRDAGSSLGELPQSAAVQKKSNNTGLPSQLKSGIEQLSGMSMDHVNVHYNSSKPAQLNAHAYAQGSDIHLAAGQEKHLPHEAWHVVQQAQGRVKPTLQMQGATVNDDTGLEKEADLMGTKALQRMGKASNFTLTGPSNTATGASPVQRVERKATVKWGVTHIVEMQGESLFGSDEEPLANEVTPDDGGQLEKGDKLEINDAPVIISRRGSNQENGEKRAQDKEGDKVYRWVRVLKIKPLNGDERDLSDGVAKYVREETIDIVKEESEKKVKKVNKFRLENIKNWKQEGIPKDLKAISEKWAEERKLTRTKSSGVLAIDEMDMRPKREEEEEGEEIEEGEEGEKEGGRGMPSGRYWDQLDEGVDVATNMADEEHELIHKKNKQWRIKAVNAETNELAGVLIVEDNSPIGFDYENGDHNVLYLRWLIGHPTIKGSGAALFAAVKKLLKARGAKTVWVESAYSAGEKYIKDAGFSQIDPKEKVTPGNEFKLELTLEEANKQPIQEEYEEFEPEEYVFKEK